MGTQSHMKTYLGVNETEVTLTKSREAALLSV